MSANGLTRPMYVYLRLIKMLPSLPCSPCAQRGGAMACGTDPAGRLGGAAIPLNINLTGQSGLWASTPEVPPRGKS